MNILSSLQEALDRLVQRSVGLLKTSGFQKAIIRKANTERAYIF